MRLSVSSIGTCGGMLGFDHDFELVCLCARLCEQPTRHCSTARLVFVCTHLSCLQATFTRARWHARLASRINVCLHIPDRSQATCMRARQHARLASCINVCLHTPERSQATCTRARRHARLASCIDVCLHTPERSPATCTLRAIKSNHASVSLCILPSQPTN